MTSSIIQSVIQYPTAYQITYTDGTISFVPLDGNNPDYSKVQAWIAAGGTATVESLPV